MKKSISINTNNDLGKVTFSVCIEDMPIKNLKKLNVLAREITEALVHTVELEGGSEISDENKDTLIQSLLGTE